ncbi:STAS domain-containing protein [Halanaerobiaceae bacterium Z-7014]|uniref:STAS domain-containing protein n=1 Tax=Halonatronomonas betaini TaxID=2778430 RepID=A0A931AVA7_9FIRM|nr:STAS domain-containing protein [Halonatronomonas betaini]MBF8437334.1 STAS domain-containing protein [Halonatronomonas betaini]
MKVEFNQESARIIFGEEMNLINKEDYNDEFMKLIEKGITDITLDFNNLKNIDSSGLGKVLHFNKILKNKGGNLKIKNINSEYVQRVFKMIELNDIIEVH